MLRVEKTSATLRPLRYLRARFLGTDRLSGAPDHHLGRLDDGERLVAPPELELVHAVAGDDRGQGLIADAEPDLREQPLDAHLLDDAAKLVAAAERDDRALRAPGPGQRPARGGEQAIDLGVGHAVVPAGGAARPHRSLVDPLFDRGVADAEALGRLARGDEVHAVKSRLNLDKNQY